MFWDRWLTSLKDSSLVVAVLLLVVVYWVVLGLIILIEVVGVAVLVVVAVIVLLPLCIVLLLLLVILVVLLVVVVLLIVCLLLLLLLLGSFVSAFYAWRNVRRCLVFSCNLATRLLVNTAHGLALHKHIVKGFFGLRSRLLLCCCCPSRLVVLLLLLWRLLLLRGSILLRWWLLCFHFLVGIIFIHLDSETAYRVFGLFCCGYDDRRDVLHPPLPVAINELCHVVGLHFWVLQVQVSWLSRALVRIPVCRDSPCFSAGIQVLSGHDAQRQVDTTALTSLEKAFMLQIHLQHVLDLKDLTHPGRADV